MGRICSSSRSVLDLAEFHRLRQLNGVFNQGGALLDLVFSSVPSTTVTSADDTLLVEDRHHPALSITFSVHSYLKQSCTRKILDYRRCNLDSVFYQLSNLNYPSSNQYDAEYNFNIFEEKLVGIIRSATPTKIIGSRKFPVWFSKRLIRLTVKKKALHRLYKCTSRDSDYNSFQALRRECKLLSKECYELHLKRLEESISTNVKSFWSHVGTLKSSSVMPDRIFYDTAEASNSTGKCQLFADYFASVFNEANVPAPSFDYNINQSISKCVFSAADVEKKLEALDPNKSAGPDGIPPVVLKYCASVISPHLTILFKALLASGIFPAKLKRSYVTPVHKSGDRSNVRNYRPIVIQSAIAKVFESIVLDYLCFNLQGHISAYQHGFFKGRSTTTNLLLLQETIIAAFLDSCDVDCIYLDFAKAFDRVDHKILLAKLKGYGICGSLLLWLSSYINGRYLIVKSEGATSLPFPVLSGVPQGSHLGPLLFCLFINDISNIVDSGHLMFADDIKVFCKISSPQDHYALQYSLDSIAAWCEGNGMELNVAKCQVITFTRRPVTVNEVYTLNGLSLKRVSSVRDLGVILSADLNPQEHISRCVARAGSLLGFIQRSTRDFKSPYPLITLYKSLIRPILEYGSIIWSPYQVGLSNMLNNIQVRFLRLIGVKLGYQYFESPIDILGSRFDLQCLKRRRENLDLLFLFKLVNGHIDCPALLEQVDLKIPLATRSRTIFRRKYLPVYYAYNSGISRLLRAGSDAACHLDFFGTTMFKFKIDLTKI